VSRARLAPFALAGLLVGYAAPVRAEWMFAAFLGASATSPNSLTVARPAAATHVTLAGVHYAGRSFDSPLYYGYRGGHTWRRFGIEGEFIHLKVYADPQRTVRAHGTVAGEDIDRQVPFGAVLERFSMSHGLNLALADGVWRLRPGGGSVALVVRSGGGVAIPHGESTVGGVSQEQYAISSFAWQGAAGAELRASRHLVVIAEYKISSAAPPVAIAGGTASGRFVSQHVVVGAGWRSR
jgi:opacity protein-like surface antigen